MNKRVLISILISGVTLLAQAPVQTCTVANIRGVPVSGTFCGGSALFASRSCTAGALYTCKAGTSGTMNNCTLAQACRPAACNRRTLVAATCFTGAAPFTVSPLNTAGGTIINLNVNLAAPHNGAIINLVIDRGDIVPGAFCAVPALPTNINSVNFALSTAVVAQPTTVEAVY